MSSFLITAWRNRTVDFTFTLYNADGSGAAVNAGDDPRFKLFRRNGDTPLLDLSKTATAAGSQITATTLTAPAVLDLRLNQNDLAGLDPGTYEAEVSVMNSVDGNVLKHAQQGVLNLMGTAAGGVT